MSVFSLDALEAPPTPPSGRGSRCSARGSIKGNEDTPNIKVCVRVRPFIKEEYLRDETPEICVEMPTSRKLNLMKPDEEVRSFEFDRSYWSFCEDDANFANQALLFQELGEQLLTHSISGFNNCIFAYGQTASGKSYSVLGAKEGDDAGLLPRIVKGLFEHFEMLPKGTTFKCLVSFIEIYNEQIRDLLTPSHGRRRSAKTDQKLEVRQHPVIGTYVPGLTEAAAGSCKEVLDLIEYGTTIRTVGATAMNQNSSRSHCIFTFKNTVTSFGYSKLSQTHLVDLAGSERTKRTEATGERLKEGVCINKSLSSLARVISALANNDAIPPFRDSKLTYILKESLCGNSKTVMIAAISPSLSDYDETLSTLRFAQSVKKVQTHAVLNEANEGDIEEQLRNEVHRLKAQLKQHEMEKGVDRDELDQARKQLQEQEDLYQRYGNWDTALANERRRSVHRAAVTHADLAHLQERFREMHKDSSKSHRRRLKKEGVESSGSSAGEEWDPLATSSSSSSSSSDADTDAPVLLHMSAKADGDCSVTFPRKLSNVQRERLSLGSLIATSEAAEGLGNAVKHLKKEAAEAESLVDLMSAPGTSSSVRLLPMAAVDPSGSDARRAQVVIAVVPARGLSDLFDDEPDAEAEPVEWLSEAQLHSRLIWLRHARDSLAPASARQRFIEGAWSACRKALQLSASLTKGDKVCVLKDGILKGTRGIVVDPSFRDNVSMADLVRVEMGGKEDPQKRLMCFRPEELELFKENAGNSSESAKVRQQQQSDLDEAARKHSAELTALRQQLDDTRCQLEQRDAELAATRQELELSARARQELLLADAARRELEQDYNDVRLSVGSPFVPLPRVEAQEGTIAGEIAASFRNALGALDQAQAALKGKIEPGARNSCSTPRARYNFQEFPTSE